MDFNGNSVLHSLGDGSETAPSQYFRGEPTSGMYREVSGPSTTSIAFSKKGTKRLRITDTGVDVIGTLTASSYVPSGTTSLPDGSASAPSLAFTSSTSSGMFWDTSGTAGQAWSIGGIKRLKLELNKLTSSVNVNLPTGSESNPSLCFSSDPTTGLSSLPGATWCMLSVGGSSKALWASDHATSSVPVWHPNGSAASPAVSFNGSTSSGLYYDGSLSKVSTSVGGGDILTVGTSSVTSTVPFSSGTNAMTCGALSCSSVSSTGQVTQPRYWVRLYRSATQALSNNTSTFVIWDAIETTFGGTSNWSVSVPLSAVAVPVNGLYQISYEIIFQNNSTAYRLGWIEINSVSPGTTRRYGEHQGPAASISQTAFVGSETLQLSAGDTVSIAANQASGGNLNLLGGTNQYCTLRIVRLSE